jgi:hypothetical protein
MADVVFALSLERFLARLPCLSELLRDQIPGFRRIRDEIGRVSGAAMFECC